MCESANVFLAGVEPSTIRHSTGERTLRAVPAFDIQQDLRRRLGPGAYVNLMDEGCCFLPDWAALYRFLPVLLVENDAPWLIFFRFFFGDRFELGEEVRLTAETLPEIPDKGVLYRLMAVDAEQILESVPSRRERDQLERARLLQRLVHLQGTDVEVTAGGHYWIGLLRVVDPVGRFGVLELRDGGEHCFATESVKDVQPYHRSERHRV